MKDRIYCVFGYKCNNDCLLCAVNAASQRKQVMTPKSIFQLLDTLAKLKNTEIEISGGEPTEAPELFYFLENLCANTDVRYTLLTNGRAFSNASVAARLADTNPFSILIPIHADTAELHDRITQAPGSFNETLQGIRNLYDCGLRVGLKTILNGISYKRLPQFVELIANKFPECPNISINGLDVQGKALINKDIIGVKLSEAAPYVEKAIETAEKYGLVIKTYSIPPCVLSEKYRPFVGKKQRDSVFSKTPKTDMYRVRLTYGTIEKCKGCRYIQNCTGSWNSYFEAYGTDEIKPIR